MTVSLLSVEREVARRLAAAGVASPEWDARQLIEHASTSGEPLEDLVRRRCNREPLQHILGVAYWRHLALAVGPGVFVPRPETELLVDAALQVLSSSSADDAVPLVVDLCAGSGAVGLAIAQEMTMACLAVAVHLVEAAPVAGEWLRRNAATVAAMLPSAATVSVHIADLAAAPADLVGRIDVVTANPPYLPPSAPNRLDAETARHDPPLALWGGTDGLAVIRRVIARAAELLRPGGTLAVEHDSSHDLSGLFDAGWMSAVRHNDLTGRPRFTVAVRA